MKVSVQCKEKVGEREDTSSEGPLPISSAPMDLILQVVDVIGCRFLYRSSELFSASAICIYHVQVSTAVTS